MRMIVECGLELFTNTYLDLRKCQRILRFGDLSHHRNPESGDAEQRLPTTGKMADVTPFPKKKSVVDMKDRYPWPPVFLKWRKSSSWMVS